MRDGRRPHQLQTYITKMFYHLLQPHEVLAVVHTVNRIRVLEGGGLYIFSNNGTAALDDVAHLSLFEGKDRSFTWEPLASLLMIRRNC